jgi:hypothetical protein
MSSCDELNKLIKQIEDLRNDMYFSNGGFK